MKYYVYCDTYQVTPEKRWAEFCFRQCVAQVDGFKLEDVSEISIDATKGGWIE